MDLSRPLRIVITGVESTGKSTLSKRLAQHFNFPLAAEIARSDVQVAQGHLAISDLNRLVIEQQTAAMDAYKYALKTEARGMISDTGGLVLEMWGMEVFKQRPEGCVSLQSWFDLHLLCTPEIPWEPDALRSLPHLEDRVRLNQVYVQCLTTRQHRWAQTQGSAPDERFLQAVRAIEQVLSDSVNT